MNLLALPFYKDASSQVQHGRCGNYATGLISPADRFLPFVVKRPVTGQGLDCVRVLAAATGRLVKTLQPAEFPHVVFTDKIWDYYTYFGGVIAGLNLPCGFYYLDVKSYISEEFEVRTNVASLLRVEWGNTSNIASIPYSQGFVQRLYLDTDLAEPEYKHDEDGDEDGDKVFVALQHRLAKTYKFVALPAHEFLIDVFNSLAIHNNVKVGDKAELNEFAVSLKWGADSCTALATVSFSERPVTAQACATDDELETLDTSGYVPKPWLCGDDSDKEPFWENTGETRCVQGDQVFKSAAITEDVFRNDCATGETAGSVSYTVAYGYAVSINNQKEADDEARKYFDATKQAYANANAKCFAVVGGGNAPVECNFGNGGCFSGRVFDPNIDAERPATKEECEMCFSEYANNGSLCPPNNC